MYKKFFMGIAAMAALTLVSCSSDDLNSVSDNSSKNEAISFDGYLGRSAVAVNGSRGSVETKEKLKTDGFGVFGNYSEESEGTKTVYGKNWFDNVKVTCPSSAWEYKPLKYWLPKGHIDFLAYAPHVDKKELKIILIILRYLVLILMCHQQLLNRKICCGLMLRIRQRLTKLLHLISNMHWLRLVIPSKQMLSVQVQL